MRIVTRPVPERTAWALEQSGVHPLLARIWAARGIVSTDDVDPAMKHLLPPKSLRGIEDAARLLYDTLEAGGRVCVVADYDCDGATACAVALRGLRLLGFAPGQLSYVVPDRAVHGYGLSPAVVDLARRCQPQLLMTVDNGIASLDGVAHAAACGLPVLVTDHHLCAVDEAGQVRLPPAAAIVNPNQPGCTFPSKSLAGVGVVFYVLLALRAHMREVGRFSASEQPRLDTLLDLVALGTVADVVRLDANNRRLVAQGLQRVRSGRMQPGIAALLTVAGRDPTRSGTQDFGFTLGPRINAAGRLADMTLGIECLLTDDPARAEELARSLDGINRERRDLEQTMRTQAEQLVEKALPDDGQPPPALALFDPAFHEGVVGIVAGRLKERLHRPTFVFARSQDGLLKGSGRSIPGFHLRDALDLMEKRHPGLLLRFGGHAMAAGATIGADALPLFAHALATVAQESLTPATLARQVATDGPLDARWFEPELVRRLDEEVWGQGFEAPTFADECEVLGQRVVGQRHLKLSLRLGGAVRDAIWFGHTEPLPARARLAYRLGVDDFGGRTRVQMLVEACEPGT